ncbi:D-serine dehydratase [Bacillus pakistanensis]|uniref:Probable D-serine dehydratase n=1 Tax=Rossellomorea pakistanensis TaxID=992288 RepID=A0ABS2NHG7_9BACI|nr:D-serine ammonia-lyase [Bacillus pakistanensis]MBM7587301.1 D-serine dehydratase [Bacillus pakistanensis]
MSVNNDVRIDQPLLTALKSKHETFWPNSLLKSYHTIKKNPSLNRNELYQAEKLLRRFAPYLSLVFPETAEMNGMIESPIQWLPSMKKALQEHYHSSIPGNLVLKCDHELPIAGSIKARGGIYEVLKYAETLALKNNRLNIHDDYSKLASETFRQFFSQYSISVGSTGNLALSIGTMAAKLGFNVTVHMSHEAKEWKKSLLRSKGVNVVEHANDFSFAVDEGRKQCMADATCYFIDDENSLDLFLGYAVAALRLKKQFEEEKIQVNENHPLIVYLPCGVGGGPGGVTYGLKHVFGDHVHCYFAEPTHSPCMLLGLATGKHERISVQDIGLDNKTDADGLAVGRPSALAGRLIERLVNGIYTVDDQNLYKMLALLHSSESISLEPSALAGMYGPVLTQVHSHLETIKLTKDQLKNATHLVWATGGSLVPPAIMEDYIAVGERCLKEKPENPI